MKSKKSKNKKFIAILLCMVLVLSSAISVFADETGVDVQSETNELQGISEEQEVMAGQSGEQLGQPEAQPVQSVEAQPVQTVEEQPVQTVEAQPVQPVEEQPAQTVEAQPVQTVQTEQEQQKEPKSPEESKKSEAVQLRQQVNLSGEKEITVVADLPEEAFNAETSKISMEVTPVSTEEDAIVKLMKNAMTERTSLGNYVMCSVTFKVDGVPTEPEKAVSIHLQGTDLNVQNVKNATMFYYNPAGSDEGNAEAELVTIIQRNDMIEALQNAGEPIPDNFDELYDLSEITLNGDGTAADIQMDGRKNRIYGCYVTEEKSSDDSQTKEVVKKHRKDSTNDVAETTAVYADTVSNYSTGTSENALSHEKYIKRNSDGTYNITLNASGTVGTEVNKKPVDIVLIVDTSGSMKENNKLRDTKNAIKALVDVFNGKADTVDAQYKLVTFSDGASIKTQTWVTGNTLYNRYVRNMEADGGTNYDKGLSEGATAIRSSTREGAKKVVIFLTDGKPTFYGDKPYNCGADTSKKTLQAALRSAELISADDFYAVGISLPGSISVYENDDQPYHRWGHGGRVTETISGQTVLDRVKNKVTATTKEAWNLGSSSELSGKFSAIAGDIINIACSNVVITDRLSEYVDVTANSKLKVKVAVKAGGSYRDKYEREFGLSTVGDVMLDGKKIATVSYDQGNKIASLTFVPSYELEEDYYYYLSITNVIPNNTAFEAYEESKYGNVTGDPATDEGNGGYAAANRGTSSGQPGFRSNDAATVRYVYKEQSKTESYAHPVVQVETIQVEKKWSGGEPADGTSILVQLLDKNGQPVEGRTIELNASNDWKGKFIVEKADNYSVGELTSEGDGTHLVVKEGGETTIDGITYQVSYVKDDSGTWAITNTKQSQTVRIIKQSTSGVNLKNAEFTLTDGNGETLKYTSAEGGIVFDGTLAHGTYTLEEVKSPGGYLKLSEKITIKVTKDNVEVTGSDKVTCKMTDDGVYEIIVKNEVLSDLPNAGGTGSFYYIFSGIVLLLVAVGLYQNNKRKMRWY